MRTRGGGASPGGRGALTSPPFASSSASVPDAPSPVHCTPRTAAARRAEGGVMVGTSATAAGSRSVAARG